MGRKTLQYTVSIVIEAYRHVLIAYAPPAGHTPEQSSCWQQVSNFLMFTAESRRLYREDGIFQSEMERDVALLML